MKWNPEEFEGITQIDFPTNKIWLPDLQLYRALGSFLLEGDSLIINYNGLVKWRPGAITKSFCSIDVRFYPFDIQTCQLTFGSWTHDGNQIWTTLKDLPDEGRKYGNLSIGMDLSEFYPSSEWDVISFPGEFSKMYYKCCLEPYLSNLINSKYIKILGSFVKY